MSTTQQFKANIVTDVNVQEHFREAIAAALINRKRPALPPVIVRKKPSSSAFLRRTINGFISTLETTYRGVAGQWPVASRILSAARA